MKPPITPLLAIALFFSLSLTAYAAPNEYPLNIKNHTFTPKELKVPAGVKIKLRITNEDATPAEFESKSLAREKIIAGKTSATVLLGPLKPGRYEFVEEFHEKEAGAQGVIIAE